MKLSSLTHRFVFEIDGCGRSSSSGARGARGEGLGEQVLHAGLVAVALHCWDAPSSLRGSLAVVPALLRLLGGRARGGRADEAADMVVHEVMHEHVCG